MPDCCSVLQSFTYSSRPEVRESAGPVLGLLAEHLEEPQFIALAEAVLKDTWSEVIATVPYCCQMYSCETSLQAYHRKHGALLSLGYVVSNCLANTADGGTVEEESVHQVLNRSLVRLGTYNN